MNDIYFNYLKFKLDNNLLKVFWFNNEDHYTNNNWNIYKRDIEGRLAYMRSFKGIHYHILSIHFLNIDDFDNYHYEFYEKDCVLTYNTDDNNFIFKLYYNLTTSRVNIKSEDCNNRHIHHGYYHDMIVLDYNTVKYLNIENYSKETKSDFRKVKINKMLNNE